MDVAPLLRPICQVTTVIERLKAWSNEWRLWFCLNRMMAEMITEITYGEIGDDEDGGHDYVEMQMKMGRITAEVVQGSWIDFFPWSQCYPLTFR